MVPLFVWGQIIIIVLYFDTSHSSWLRVNYNDDDDNNNTGQRTAHILLACIDLYARICATLDPLYRSHGHPKHGGSGPWYAPGPGTPDIKGPSKKAFFAWNGCVEGPCN